MRPRLGSVFVPPLADVPCNCLLLEEDGRLTLVDAGLGIADMKDPSRLGVTNVILNARPDIELTALRQVERLGYDPAAVTDIICTHLDRDHAGGLADFPRAKVHVTRAERDAALLPGDASEKDRYRRCHFSHGPQWVLHEDEPGDEWFGFACERTPAGLPGGMVLVPLPGHTRGHCGVAIERPGGWLLHCGDAYYVHQELEPGAAHPGVRMFRRVAHHDYGKAMVQAGASEGPARSQ